MCADVKKRVVISIDGGGIRGIIPLVVLREIQSNIKGDLHDIVSSWFGTSAGAVICASLRVQKGTEPFRESVQDVLDIYEFRSQSAINPSGSQNPSRALYKIFDQNFGQFEMKDMPDLNIVACRRSPIEAVVFNKDNNCNLGQAVKATCAVPGIFEKVQIGTEYYVDGFLRAKNPSSLAIQDEILDPNLVLISLGTGVLRVHDAIEQQVKDTHAQLQSLSAEKGFHYFRFDPVLNLAEDNMQNTSLKNIFNLKKDAEQYLIANKEMTSALARLLED